MRFLVAGAGAIGGYIGARLAQFGYEVTLFARGPHLAAMREHGLRVTGPGGEFTVRPHTIGALEEAGPVDVILLGVKAHGLANMAPQLKPLITGNTIVVSTQNGVPWWYFQVNGGELTGFRLERVDPGGIISESIDASRVVGSIVYFSTEIAQPGVIRHIDGDRISLGEPDGSRSDRAREIAGVMIKAGLRAPITTRIKEEIWVKLMGNASFNPISALTRATLVRMARDPEVSHLVRNIMAEVTDVATKLGMSLPISVEQRIAGAEKIGEHKTSMLQDLEAGRPLELEAVVGAVIEIADRVGVPVPNTKAVYACAKLLEKTSIAPRPQPAEALRELTAIGERHQL